MSETWSVHHPRGRRRVVVTRALPGRRWLDVLVRADCRVEVGDFEAPLSPERIEARIGSACDGAIGQLTEDWNAALFERLAAAGGTAFSTYAVGYDNVDVEGATRAGVAVGHTPGVLTETTAEMAVALTLAAARRVVEADRFTRAGLFRGWRPDMLLGTRLRGRTVGVIGCGRIGSAYARMMVTGFEMSLVYFDPKRNDALEDLVAEHGQLLARRGEDPVTVRRVETVDGVLERADVVSLHPRLGPETTHLLDADRLARMKPDAILVNTSRGPVIDEAALVDHCRAHPDFRVGLDVFEDEPRMAPGLTELDNVTVVPHIASATRWTREGMGTLAAANVVGILEGHPVWKGSDVRAFLEGDLPPFAPAIVNASALGLT